MLLDYKIKKKQCKAIFKFVNYLLLEAVLIKVRENKSPQKKFFPMPLLECNQSQLIPKNFQKDFPILHVQKF